MLLSLAGSPLFEDVLGRVFSRSPERKGSFGAGSTRWYPASGSLDLPASRLTAP